MNVQALAVATLLLTAAIALTARSTDWVPTIHKVDPSNAREFKVKVWYQLRSRTCGEQATRIEVEVPRKIRQAARPQLVMEIRSPNGKLEYLVSVALVDHELIWNEIKESELELQESPLGRFHGASACVPEGVLDRLAIRVFYSERGAATEELRIRGLTRWSPSDPSSESSTRED